MLSYLVGLMSLAEKFKVEVPEPLKPLFADNLGLTGELEHAAQCLDFFLDHGPAYGYFPEVGKSYYICKAKDVEVVRTTFDSRNLDIRR